MIIGESRFFDLTPATNEDISQLQGTYEIKSPLGDIVKHGVVDKSIDNTAFQVRIQTAGMERGKYTLHILQEDIDGFISDIYSEPFILE